MTVEINDERPLVKINARDNNKVIVQEVNNQVKITGWGPQGAVGPQGPTGPAGPQGESGQYTISENAPTSNVSVGDLWFRSDTAQLYFYYDGYWIETSTSYAGPAGASATEPTAIRYSPTFQATGLTFTGSGATYPTYNSYYVKFGQLVSFNIKIDLNTVTNFGTGQLKVDLPFAPIASAANHFSAWSWVDPSQPADELNGHIQMVADHLAGSQTLDLHWLKETTANPKPLIESLLIQGTPITFTTASKIYVNGTYISAS